MLLVILTCGVFISCSQTDEDDNELYYNYDTVYAQACSLGYTGTLEEFIELISGRDGVGITSSLIDQNGHLIFVLSNGQTIDAGLLPSADPTIGVFNVSFDFGNDNIITVQSNNFSVTPPQTPEKEGHQFLYWYCTHDYLGEMIWSFDAYAITKDITLYAKWMPSEDEPETVGSLDLEEIIATMEPVTITFYHTMGGSLGTVLEDYITEFNKLYPNITINHRQVGSYDDVRDTIKTEIAVGAQPNIAYCYPDHVALYNNSSAVVTLDQFINSRVEITDACGNTTVLGFTDEQIADFVGGFFEEGRQFGDNQLYSIPLSKSTEVLYYNKTFFDQHGLTVPTTWEEMEAVCAQIKAIDPSCIPLGYDSESNWFITMCAQYGSDYTSATGEHFIFDNEENYAFVEMLRGWYEKGYVITQELNGGIYASELFTATTGTKSYMSIASSAGATHQRPRKDANGNYLFEVGVAPIPQIDASNPKAISQGPSLCIFNSENPDEIVASWLFVKFLATNIDFQAKFSMVSGYMPVIKSVTESKLYSDFLAKADGGDYISALVAKVCLEEYSSFITTPAFNGSSTARAQVGILIKNCFIQKPQSGEDVKAMIKRLFQNAIDECEYKLGQ